LKGGQHPNPKVELDFWESKSKNLNYICHQLSSERIKKVLKFLEQNKSTYTGPFSKLQKEVQTARIEANDNYLYLQTLNELFTELTNDSLELEQIADLFMPIMHTILMIWTYSQYYNTPSRLVVLIREISNAVIDRCRNFIDKDKIFGFIEAGDPKSAHNNLQQALDTCAKFKESYHEYKAQVRGQWKIT
jgi:dynein heavy chain